MRTCELKAYKKSETVLYKKAPREGLLLILNGMAEVFVASGFDMQHAEKEVLEVLQTVEESTKESIHELESAMYDVLANLIQDGIPTVHTLDVMTKLCMIASYAMLWNLR